MRNLILTAIFIFSLSFGVNATPTKENNNELTFESCVSIAARIAGGDSEKFKAAYVGCIEGRINNN